jgi:hypothetical protein
MVKKLGISAALLAGVLLIGVQMSQGLVIPEADKDRVKFRLDVGKQIAKFADCLGKVGNKCITKTDPNAFADPNNTICSALDPDSSDGISAEDLAAYKTAIAKCESKINLSKKIPEGVGTTDAYADPNVGLAYPHDPIDCPAIATDMASYQDVVIASAKKTVDEQMEQIPALCTLDSDLGPTKCATKSIGLLLKGAKGLFKCQQACEGDYANKKGNGGPDDALRCCNTQGPGTATDGKNRYGACSVDAAYKTCRDSVMSKAQATADKLTGFPALVWAGGKAQLEAEVDNATLELFDATPDPCP